MPENARFNRYREFELFAKWLAMSPLLRHSDENQLTRTGITNPDELGLVKIKTQKDFAAQFSVDEKTLYRWKQKVKLRRKVDEFKRAWGRDKTPSVLFGLYRRAVQRGDAASVKLWLQYVEDWVPPDGKQSQKMLRIAIITEDGIKLGKPRA